MPAHPAGHGIPAAWLTHSSRLFCCRRGNTPPNASHAFRQGWIGTNRRRRVFDFSAVTSMKPRSLWISVSASATASDLRNPAK